MAEKGKLQIIKVQPWEIVDETTGELKKGTTLHCQLYSNLTEFPIPHRIQSTPDFSVCAVGEVYSVDISIGVGSRDDNGKAVLLLTNFVLVPKTKAA